MELDIKKNSIITVFGQLPDLNETFYRVLFVDHKKGFASLIELNTTKVKIEAYSLSFIQDWFQAGRIIINKQENSGQGKSVIVSDIIFEKYKLRKQMVDEISALYGPSYLGISQKTPKPELEQIREKYSLSRATFWRILRRYLQSGCQIFSLLDLRAKGFSKPPKKYNYCNPTGRKGKSNSKIIVNDVVEYEFLTVLRLFRSMPHFSIMEAYKYLLKMYYSDVRKGESSEQNISLVSPRPSYRQFYYFYKTKFLNNYDNKKN